MAFFVTFLLLVSCKDHNNKISDNSKPTVPKDTFPTIKPYQYKNQEIKDKNAKITSITGYYNKYWNKNRSSGSFLVAEKGKILFEQYSGYANYKEKDTVTAQTPLHLASVSKYITAIAIIKLIDEGLLGLDQKVNTILSNFPYENITVRTLLNHRSGLTNYAYYFDDRKIWNHSEYLTNQNILDIFAKNKVALDFKTDTKFAYCNTNYAMLALIIEKVTRLKFDQALQKMIFDPLQMKHTKIATSIDDIYEFSQSYKGSFVLHHFDHLDAIYGDKNIYSTPRDLLKFDTAVNNPAFVRKELVQEIYKGYSYERKGKRNYGLGIRLLEYENGTTLFYHNGWWHGNTTSFVKVKEQQVVIIALSNKYTTVPYKSYILATLFGDFPIEIKNNDLVN